MDRSRRTFAFTLCVFWVAGCSTRQPGMEPAAPVIVPNAVTAAGALAPAAVSGMPVAVAGTGVMPPASGAGVSAAAGRAAVAPAGPGMTVGTPNRAGVAGMVAAPASVPQPAPATNCSRELLRGTVDKYFAALAAHDPSSLPRAASLKFTENTKAIQLGEGVVWKTAGMVKFSRSLLDTERCGSVTEAVIPNSGTDTIFGLRLKLAAEQQLVEVEQIVVDPMTGFSPQPMGLLNSKSQAWEDVLPPEQRSTREQLEAAGRAYFMAFQDPATPVPYNKPCDRLENGTQTTFGDCSNFGPAGGGGFKMPASRYPVSDLEAGSTAGFLLFGGGMIDFHMFKLIGGKIRWIHAVVGPTAFSSGWPMQ